MLTGVKSFYNMRRALIPISIICGGIAGLAFAFFSATVPAKNAEGELRLEPADYLVEYKNGAPRTAKQFSLRVRNSGGKPLTIIKIESHCGCTVVSMPAGRYIAPNEGAEISVRATPPAFGEKRTSVDIYTNSPVTPVLRASLLLKGAPLTVPHATIIPDVITITGRPATTETINVVISTAEARSATPWISSLRPQDPSLTTELRGMKDQVGLSAATVQREYTFELAARVGSGHRKDMTMCLEATDGTTVKVISVVVQAVAQIRAAPESIFVLINDATKFPVVRRISLLAETGLRRPIFAAIHPVCDFLTVDAEEAPQQSIYSARLKVQIAEPPPGMPDNGAPLTLRVRIQNGDMGCPAIEVPVTIVCKKNQCKTN